MERLGDLPGSPVLFLDACNAGRSAVGAPRQAFSAFNAANAVQSISSAVRKVIIFASSDGGEASEENASWRNGAFTAALIERLKRKSTGAENQADKITPDMLEEYVSRAVVARTNGRQHPKRFQAIETIRFLAEPL